ncbi:hypothetical protein V6N13_091371 [Hibiscus sabdariffa]
MPSYLLELSLNNFQEQSSATPNNAHRANDVEAGVSCQGHEGPDTLVEPVHLPDLQPQHSFTQEEANCSSTQATDSQEVSNQNVSNDVLHDEAEDATYYT